MPGEPQCGTNDWIGMDVTKLQIVDEDGVPSQVIMNRNSSFDLYVEFKICGHLWPFLACLRIPYQVIYYADQHGGPFDQQIGVRNGNLIPGQDKYGQTETFYHFDKNTLPEGTYELTAVVKFPGGKLPDPPECVPLAMTGHNGIPMCQSM